MKERGILFSAAMVRAILEGRKSQTRRVCYTFGENMHNGPIMRLGFIVSSVFNRGRRHAGMEMERKFTGKGWGLAQCIQTDVDDYVTFPIRSPYGQPGDRMVVREAYWAWGKWVPNGATAAGRKKFKFMPVGTSLRYQENPPKQTVKRDGECGWVYRHARYMPKAHSRITLELTDVRVQRVQEISEEDAKAEGVWRETFKPSYKVAFAVLWDSINAKRGFGWVENVWVWALTFRRLP